MKLSKSQLGTFFSEVKKAAENVGQDAEQYRKEIMLQEVGVEHLRDVTKTTGYDKLMQRVYSDQGNYEKALAFVDGDVKRMRFLAIRTATRILLNKGKTGIGDLAVMSYIAGLMIQMNLSGADREHLAAKLMRENGWDDFTPIQLRRVVAALTIHARRKT